MELFDLTGKVALVTGGTHGLGMAIAKGLAKVGAKIVVNDIFKEKLSSALEEYRRVSIQAHGYLFDVSKEDDVIDVLGRIEREVGPIDILVNNAGIIKRIPMIDMKVE
ncbi:MAG TPA: SDR family NAD(P)-dependent oxidoreductase, partial [bacterium]